MKERPITMTGQNGQNGQRCHDGTKTQTRRIMKPQPTEEYGHPEAVEFYNPEIIGKDGEFCAGPTIFGAYWSDWGVECHYGGPGTRLWVKEEHYRFGHWEPVEGVLTKTGRQKWKFVADSYDARFDPPESFRKGRHSKDPGRSAWHKRLARFMPRRFSRTLLEVVFVRVQRVQDISPADVVAEGFPFNSDLDQFKNIWRTINGPGSWERNPFVWAVEFKRINNPER